MIDFGFDLAGREDRRLKPGLVFASIGALLEASPLLVTILVVERVLSGAPLPMSLPALAGALVVLLLVTYFFKIFGTRLNFGATYAMVCDIRLRTAEHLRRLPMGFWNAQRTGSSASALTDEFALYTEVVTHSWALVVANIALPVGMGAVLLFADWRLALLAFAPVPVAIAAIPWSFRLLNRSGDKVHAQRRTCADLLVEYIQGIETLRGLKADAHKRKELDVELRALERRMMEAELAPAPAIFTYSLLVFLGFVLLVAGGVFWVVPDGVPTARFVLVTMVALHFARSLQELVLYLAASRHAARTLQRLRALWAVDEQPEGTQTTESATLGLSVDHVAFSYEEQATLQDVSVAFAPGTVTALVGPSGSGKSTLAHLLTRLWDVNEGTIRLGGHDLRTLTLEDVQRQTATVFQDVVLFQGTVRDNLTLGRSDASDDDVVKAAKAARAHDFITALPDGYDTALRAGGEGLSGGQKQRLSIARALLKNAPVLILDEATASVDLDEERLIQEAIAELARGRTVVVVAHRLWTVQHADNIVVLQDGKVLQQGRHPALLDDADGLYRRMWDVQQDNRGFTLQGAIHA